MKGFGKDGGYKGYTKGGFKGKGGGKGTGWGVHGMWEEDPWHETCSGSTMQLFGVTEVYQVPKKVVKAYTSTTSMTKPPRLMVENRFELLAESEDDCEEECTECAAKVHNSPNIKATVKNKDKTRGREPRKEGRGQGGARYCGEDVDDGLPIMALFSPDPEVNHIKAPHWVKLEAVVDSGAAESVAPESMAPWVPMRESEGSRRGQTYLSASGDKLPNLGEKKFDMMTSEGNWAQATFQVAEVTRPLCSVSKICDKGNRVIFELGGGYVEHIATGMRTKFARQNNVYVMEMHVQDGSNEEAKVFGRQRV